MLITVPWLAALPLAFAFADQPLQLWTLLSLSASVFRAYPSLTDVARSVVSSGALSCTTPQRGCAASVPCLTHVAS